jgi:hypothetical protein
MAQHPSAVQSPNSPPVSRKALIVGLVKPKTQVFSEESRRPNEAGQRPVPIALT